MHPGRAHQSKQLLWTYERAADIGWSEEKSEKMQVTEKKKRSRMLIEIAEFPGSDAFGSAVDQFRDENCDLRKRRTIYYIAEAASSRLVLIILWQSAAMSNAAMNGRE